MNKTTNLFQLLNPHLFTFDRIKKMTKRLMLMRGPEKTHDFLVHEQYGIMATGGGRMRHQNFENVRMSILKKIDTKRMFAIWRIAAPWQPITKKGKGMRMGGGKAAIDHYVTPVRPNRIIMEVAGHCEYAEVGFGCGWPLYVQPQSPPVLVSCLSALLLFFTKHQLFFCIICRLKNF